MAVSGVIFDFDGTLFDSMPIWNTIAGDFLVEVGIEPKPDLREQIRARSLEEVAHYMVGEYGLSMTPADVDDHINEMICFRYSSVIEPKPGALELVEDLHQAGIPLAVATATDAHHIEAALDRYGILSRFGAITTVRMAGRGKLYPDVYDMALERIGSERASTWVFEDAVHAIRTALDAGYRVAAVHDESVDTGWDEILQLVPAAYETLEIVTLEDLETMTR